MTDSDNNPETLVSVPTDLEAAMIVSTLAAHGVDATSTGGFTAGFRAEAPGEVNVLVRRNDLARARELLEQLIAAKENPSTDVSQNRDAPNTSAQVGWSAKNWLGLALIFLVLVAVLKAAFGG